MMYYSKMVGVLYLIVAINFLCYSIHCAKNCTEICHSLGDFMDCSSKELTEVPINIPTWVSHLNLNKNLIQSFKSDAFQNLTHLIRLKMYMNRIVAVPKDAFDKLKHLELLDFTRNGIDDIQPLTFKSTAQLHTLKLKHNRLSQLRDGAFFGLVKIKSLFLDYNHIKVVSKRWLYGLDNIKELSLCNNDIKEIHTDAWDVCKVMTFLDLSYNKLQAIQKDTFKHLNNLEILRLQNNNITFIKEGAFEHLQSLITLFLSHNRISWAIEDGNGVFASLSNLQHFHIVSNNITSVNKNAFRGLTSVVYLDLIGNNITTISKDSLGEVPALQQLTLNTTALICDCNLKWFYDWLSPKQFRVHPICAYPEQLRGISLRKLHPNNLTCVDLPKPKFVQVPLPEMMALKGKNITLNCKAISSTPGPMIFTWKKDNVVLVNADVSVITTTFDGKTTVSTSTLKVDDVKNSDAGKYQCIVSNEYGATYSQRSSISVLVFPMFVKTPQNLTVKAGTTVRLECGAHGEPLPEIAWQKDGGNDFPAARERRMHVMPTDDVFFIVNAKPSDKGIYSCTAKNAAGTIVTNATLLIEESPSFMKPMGNKEVTEGESVIFECTASGIPKPAVQWLKDNDSIHATERHFFTAEDQLMIIVDTILSDAGTYQCKLNNSMGTKIDYCELIVKPAVAIDQLMGIVIITVVCCAVLTSIVWVVIIYNTRRCPSNIPIPVIHSQTADIDTTPIQSGDNTSQNSSCKDSGTGKDDVISGDEVSLVINDSTHYVDTINEEDGNEVHRRCSTQYVNAINGEDGNGVLRRSASLLGLAGDRNNSPLLYQSLSIPKDRLRVTFKNVERTLDEDLL